MSAPSADAPSLTPATPLKRAFVARPTAEVAQALLGVWLLRELDGQLLGGPIVETEAYGGPEDGASHARAGLTRRTAPMFGPSGHAYVYLVYGMHHCLNVVGHAPPAEAGAVLIRAIEPRVGVEVIRANRAFPGDPDVRLCAGPARLCQALGVNRDFDGHDLTTGHGLWLSRPPDLDHARLAVSTGPRIGVAYAGDGWAQNPWRFWLTAHPSVSR